MEGALPNGTKADALCAPRGDMAGAFVPAALGLPPLPLRNEYLECPYNSAKCVMSAVEAKESPPFVGVACQVRASTRVLDCAGMTTHSRHPLGSDCTPLAGRRGVRRVLGGAGRAAQGRGGQQRRSLRNLHQDWL